MAIAKMLLPSVKSDVQTKLMMGYFGELPKHNSRKRDSENGGIYDRVDEYTKKEYFGECLGRGHIFKLIKEVWLFKGVKI